MSQTATAKHTETSDAADLNNENCSRTDRTTVLDEIHAQGTGAGEDQVVFDVTADLPGGPGDDITLNLLIDIPQHLRLNQRAPGIDKVLENIADDDHRNTVAGAFERRVLPRIEAIRNRIESLKGEEAGSDKANDLEDKISKTYQMLKTEYADGRKFFRRGELAGLTSEERGEVLKFCKGLVKNLEKDQEFREIVPLNKGERNLDVSSGKQKIIPADEDLGRQVKIPSNLDQSVRTDLQNSVNGIYGDKKLTCQISEAGECTVMLESTSSGLKRGLTRSKKGNSSLSFRLTEEGASEEQIREKLTEFIGEKDALANDALFLSNGLLGNKSELLNRALHTKTDLKLLSVDNSLIKDAQWMHVDISGTVFTNVIKDNVDCFDMKAEGVVYNDCKAKKCTFDEANMKNCHISEDSDFSGSSGINTLFTGGTIEGLMNNFNAAGADLKQVTFRNFKTLADLKKQLGGMVFDEKKCSNTMMLEAGKEIPDNKAYSKRLKADRALKDLDSHPNVSTEAVQTANDKHAVVVKAEGINLLLERVKGDRNKVLLKAIPGGEIQEEEEKNNKNKRLFELLTQDPKPLEAMVALKYVFQIMDGEEPKKIVPWEPKVSKGSAKLVSSGPDAGPIKPDNAIQARLLAEAQAQD